jgi:hypothetical protein
VNWKYCSIFILELRSYITKSKKSVFPYFANNYTIQIATWSVGEQFDRDSNSLFVLWRDRFIVILGKGKHHLLPRDIRYNKRLWNVIRVLLNNMDKQVNQTNEEIESEQNHSDQEQAQQTDQ